VARLEMQVAYKHLLRASTRSSSRADLPAPSGLVGGVRTCRSGTSSSA
jgi:hypothetical protein